MTGVRHAFAIAVLAFTTASPLSSQTIRGLVLNDSTSEPISGAEVTLLDTLGLGVTQTVSGSDGRFRLKVAPGEYLFRVLRIGYAPTVTTSFEVLGIEEESNVVIRVPVASALFGDDPYVMTSLVVQDVRVPRHLAEFYQNRQVVHGSGVEVVDDTAGFGATTRFYQLISWIWFQGMTVAVARCWPVSSP